MYNEIADVYHLVYADWNAAIAAQAASFDSVITSASITRPAHILDISCGIGTQSLGLAQLGHRVLASDLSSAAIGRATKEAVKRELDISFSVADMRDCFETHGGNFDVVLTCDNSVPHLPTPTDIRDTFEGMCSCLRKGGLALVGIRNYLPDEVRGVGQIWPYGTRTEGSDRWVVFQTRDWQGSSYDVGMYFVREMTPASPALVISGLSRYHAITVDDTMALMAQSGFVDVVRDDTLLHQPLIIARKP